jgi:hypothetical protein
VYVMCQVAAVTDWPLTRDAPGVAHLVTMTALHGPVPKLIRFTIQYLHFVVCLGVSALISIARFSAVIDNRRIHTVFQDEGVDNGPTVHTSPAFVAEVRPPIIFANQ